MQDDIIRDDTDAGSGRSKDSRPGDDDLGDTALDGDDPDDEGSGSMSDPIGDPLKHRPGMDDPEVRPDHVVPPGNTTSRDLDEDDAFIDPAEGERGMGDDPLMNDPLTQMRRI